ncbi:hypothetical protein ACFOWU_09560 [Epilithonimonas zeae]|uniref:HTH cro/C1-type domain-containing protein n=1 Tax=Epilithonimonas zeae TaxID=1416779 RepID=A0A1N6GR02_9FLAO|nr:hypothetical protein [Epilithonimonas zeae]SIO09917.1 hypothetical protein SAMN05444409_1995 [Epilithonimonas zeae]
MKNIVAKNNYLCSTNNISMVRTLSLSFFFIVSLSNLFFAQSNKFLLDTELNTFELPAGKNYTSGIPRADALKNIADALGISSDALLNDETVSIKDKELLKKFEVIQEMNEEDRAMITRFLDLTIRDYKAKKAYS